MWCTWFSPSQLEARGGNLSKALQPFIQCTAAALERMESERQGRIPESRRLGGLPELRRFPMTQRDVRDAVIWKKKKKKYFL